MAKKKKKEKWLKQKVKFKKLSKKQKPLTIVVKRTYSPYHSVYFKEEWEKLKNDL